MYQDQIYNSKYVWSIFVISEKNRPAEILYIATTMFNCWVFGSANYVSRPDRDNQYNMRIVYNDKM